MREDDWPSEIYATRRDFLHDFSAALVGESFAVDTTGGEFECPSCYGLVDWDDDASSGYCRDCDANYIRVETGLRLEYKNGCKAKGIETVYLSHINN